MQQTLSFLLNYRLLVTFITIFVLLPTSFAQLSNQNPANSTNKSLSSKDIEVIKVSTEQTVISNNFAVIKREDFANTSQSLADLLQSINGLQIRQIGGLGNPVSVSIRGSNSKQVQLFIDNQLVNDSQFGSFDLNQIPTEHIESIEVSKNQAIGTGSTPIGGVIRINTYNPNKKTAKLSLATGSFNYQELNALYNTSFYKKHNISVGGSYLSSDNDYDYLVPSPVFSPNTPTTQPLRNNEFIKRSAFINTNFAFEHHQLRFNIQYNNQDKNLPNYQNNTLENSSSLSSESYRYGYEHIWSSDINWLDTIELSLNYEDKEERFLDIPTGTLNLDGNYDTIKQSAELKTYLVFDSKIGEFKTTPFISFTKQTFDTLSITSTGIRECNGLSIISCDVSAEQEQRLIGARVEWQTNQPALSAYALVSELTENNSNVTINNINAADDTTLNREQTFNTRELGINFTPKAYALEFTYSKGIRTATLFELFGDRGLLRGNNNLLPEEAETFTLGGSFSNKFLNVPYSVSSALYHQNNNNSIIAIFNSSGIGSFTNVNDATLKGFELEVTTNLTDKLALTIQTNIIDSDTTSVISSFNNRNIPGVYHQQYSAEIQYKINQHWSAKLQTNLDKDLYFDRANLLPTDLAERKTTSFSLNWQQSIYNINLFVDNLFDEQYQDLANRPAQGLNAQLKLSIKGF